MKPFIRILILDDDTDMLDFVKQEFDRSGIEGYEMFTNASDFFRNFDENVHVAIIDHYADAQMTGMQVLERIADHNQKRPSIVKCKVIIMSGQANVKVVANYMNTRKASFYVVKDSDGSFFYELTHWTKVAIDEIHHELTVEQMLHDKRLFYTSLTMEDHGQAD